MGLALTVNTGSKMLFFTGLSQKNNGVMALFAGRSTREGCVQIINSNMNKIDLKGNEKYIIIGGNL